VLLGGRAAEELIFNEISTGAGNDLERATEMARRMVSELGMSDRLGPVTLQRPTAPWVNGLEPRRAEYSEATAQVIDAEVHRLISEQYQRAMRLLETGREILVVVAERLLQKEVMEREELRRLMGRPLVVSG
jgi:cell division protease FtsH